MSRFKKPLELSIEDSADLGFCTVNKCCEFPLTITNPNVKPINYTFKFTEFLVTPSSGTLMPNSVNNFKIEVKLTEATVVIGTVILEADDAAPRVLKLSAVGKYPYIAATQHQLEFGEVNVHKTLSKELILKNSSEVTASFRIKIDGDQSEATSFFSFSPNSGDIPSKASFVVKVTFQPSVAGMVVNRDFLVQCECGNTSRVRAKGFSKPISVSLTNSSLNFGEIKLDTTSSKVLTLVNNSDVDSEFQFFTDPNNVFCFHDTKGTIGRQSTKKIIVEFRPRNTIAYYERVHCVVRNHQLLFVDLIGTCYDLLIKPIPLMQNHIDIFRRRVIAGRISQIELKYIENNLLLRLMKKGQTDVFQETDHMEPNFYQSGFDLQEDTVVMHKELFLENPQRKLIAISEDSLEFGGCQVMTLSGQREFEVVSRLQCKLNLFWIGQKHENLNGEYMSAFQVFPETATLKPNVPVKFQVTFRPLKTSMYYFQHLQFYAIKANSKVTKKTLEELEYKQLKAKPESILLRSVKMNQTIQARVKEDVEATQQLPPITGSIKCVGHSFQSTSMPFMPITKLLPSARVDFAPCGRGSATYNTCVIANQSDTAIFFKIGNDPSKVFRVQPKIGLIQPKSMQLLAFEFAPKEHKLYNSQLSIFLNEMPRSDLKLQLVGRCDAPSLTVENNGQIYFTPTFTGVYSQKNVTIRNSSSTKLTFKVAVPPKYQEELAFEPAEKTLEPNETATLVSFFSPHLKKAYKVKVPIYALEVPSQHNFAVGFHEPGSGAIAKLENQISQEDQIEAGSFEVHGQGSDGTLQLSHEQINFETVKITEQKKINFKVKNLSDCAFFIELNLKSDSKGAQNTLALGDNKKLNDADRPTDAHIQSMFSLDMKEGVLPANSQTSIWLTFTPTEVFNFDIWLAISTKERVPKKTGTLKPKGMEAQQKCQLRVKAIGSYPLLEIVDIRNDTLSVAALWENFQIQKINKELACHLSSDERQYQAVENLSFTEAKQLQARLKKYQWNLGYVSTKNKAKPRKVIITVRNYGGAALDCCFKFPSDNKVHQQLWADPGEPSEEEAYERAILEKNIFQIKPRVCQLGPGETKDVELIYSPASIDINKTSTGSEVHQLKVVFQIVNGKPLVFNLKGTTLGPNQGLLTVKKNLFVLPDAPVGLLKPLRFPIEVNNVGSIKVNYKTEVVYEASQFQDVFCIENPQHFVLSGENHYLYCLYRPLLRLPAGFGVLIHVYDFQRKIQTLELKLMAAPNLGNPLAPLSTHSHSHNNNGNNNHSITKSNDNTTKATSKTIVKAIPGQRTGVSQIGSKVFFSIEQIDFGVVQPQSVQYKMVILYNTSKQFALSFQFITQSALQNRSGLTCADKLTIESASGTLEPNSFAELKLTLAAAQSLSVYQGEIPCQIVWSENKVDDTGAEYTQREVSLIPQRQTLFLRLKKSTAFTVTSQPSSINGVTTNNNNNLNGGGTMNQVSSSHSNSPSNNTSNHQTTNKKSLLNSIFSQLIQSLLNDQQLENQIGRLTEEKIGLVDLLSDTEAVAVGQTLPPTPQPSHARDFSSPSLTILTDQFQQVVQLIVQNTFFNIIQETTHRENDFLKVGKRFVQGRNKVDGFN